MDIRGKRRAFVPVDRAGVAEQAPKTGQDSGVERATGTPKARYTAGQKVLGARWKVTALIKVGKLAAKKLELITYHLQPLGRFIARLWRTPVVIRIRKFVAKILQTTNYALKTLARFIMSWPVWLRRGVSAALIIGLITGGYLYIHNQQYKLSNAEQKLLALPSVDLKMVKETKDGFTYNHAQEQKVDGHSITTAAAPADSTGKFPYEVTLPHNESAGIKFSDSTGDLSFTMKPNFSTAAGREDKGRVIYPEGLNSVHAYTFKRNGVKEDIILSKAPGSDTYTKSWTLNLGDKLEAKMLPNGGVGIYSADSMLFGNVQASDPKDQALIDKARKNGQKTNLAFVIPAPYVSDATGQKYYQNIKFSLKNNVLTLTVQNMKSRSYPLSIDPTLVVTTSADFVTGSDADGMIDFSTSDQIGRNDLGYGMSLTLLQKTSAFTTTREGHTSVAYNGYLYIIGGGNGAGTYYNDISYCPINSDGTVGTCTQQTNAFTTGRYTHTSVVYNGYLYIIGGYNSGALNDIQYCPLNSNGSVGTCTQQTSAFSTARSGHASVVYNGYLYIIGGVDNTSTKLNDIQYCPLNSNGSVGACTGSANFTSARYYHTAVVNNGYLYIIGGHAANSATGCDGSGFCNDIQYCPLNTDGSVGTCTQQLSAFTAPRYNHATVSYDGYLYISGGQHAGVDTLCNPSANLFCTDIQYCPFNSNGSVGTCTQQKSAFSNYRYMHAWVVYQGRFYISGGVVNGSNQNDILYGLLGKYGSLQLSTQQTNAFTSARSGLASVVYNGYLYITGGLAASNATGCDANGYCRDIIYCPLSSNGSVGACTQQLAAFTTARYWHDTTVSNGYLYITGGISTAANASGCDASSNCNDIQYCPINSNGSVGACTQQLAAFTTARYGHKTLTYNGYLYVIGGYNGSSLQNDIQYCPINSNGSVGACTQQTSAFTTARYLFGSAIFNGYLYIVGGNASGAQNDIQYCPINSNGSVGACTQQTSAFTTARYSDPVIINNGYLYIIGGTGTGGPFNDIQYCPINSNGSVGACTQQLGSFTGARIYFAATISNGYIYLLGGVVGGTKQNDIQYVPIVGGNLGTVGTTTQQTAAITSARYGQATVVYKGYLYISGGKAAANATGCDSSGNCNDIQYCPINANGSIGACTQSTNKFTPARSFHTSVAYNDYLYIIGGSGSAGTGCGAGGGVCNDIWRCSIGGGVGSCTQQTSAFTTARAEHSSVIYNGYLYIIGGTGTGGPFNDIQYCPVGVSGAVGSCTQQTSAFTTARYYHSSVAYNGYLYIIGGYSSGVLNDIQYCPLNTNGSVGTCVQKKDAFAIARYGQAAFVTNGYLYIDGGYTGTSYLNDIQNCPLLSNGSVDKCMTSTTTFTSARAFHSSVVYNDYLYIIGGQGSGTGCTSGSCDDMQYAQLTTRGFGSVGATVQQTSAFTSARSGLTSVVYNGYLYIIGGKAATSAAGCDAINGYCNDIQYCPLNADGSVGTCTQQTSAFTSTRDLHTSVVYNGYLYIIGGQGENSSTGCDSNGRCNDIQYCPLNSNGSVGACTQQTSAFTTPRYAHTSVVYNGYLYIIGGLAAASATGCDTHGYCNDIQYCPLNSNGSVGTCTQQTSAFPTARGYHTSVVFNGYVYIVGGNNNFNGTGCSSSNCDDIQHCLINANGSVGTCVQQVGAITEGARYSHASIIYNNQLYMIGGSSGSGNEIEHCVLNTDGSVKECFLQLGAFTTGRNNHSSVFANGYIYIIGGGNGPTYYNDIQHLPVIGPPPKAKYERVMDVGYQSQNLAAIVYNGSTTCSASLSYKTADSSGVFGTATTINGATAGTSYSLNIANKRYLWVSIVMDDSSCVGNTNVTDITLTYAGYPAAPTLNSPGSGVTGASVTPTFQMRSTDPNNDYLRYKIDVCSVSDCSTIIRTIDQTASQTGWSGQDTQTSTAYIGSATITSSTMANYTYQTPALSPGTQYWWRAYAIDPGGDNVFSAASSIQSFTTSFVPAAPTLIAPSAAATGVSSTASFQLRATDADNDYLQYKIQLCSDSLCNTVVQTLDQTSSQSGWFGQDVQSATAYTGNATLANSTIATYTFQSPSLKANTQYWWRAYAIDPGGSNTFSSASSIGTFTTAQNETFFKGGFNLNGGVRLGP